MEKILNQLGINSIQLEKVPALFIGGEVYSGTGNYIDVFTPIDGSKIAGFNQAIPSQLDEVEKSLRKAFLEFRKVPAPIRGGIVREFGELIRANKNILGDLITLETGKIIQEARGEVQEVIDICEFALGLSRQLHGLSIVSERPNHRLMEQWQPLGPIGIISAFNFPMAVWAWNAALAIVCGNTLLWKPSEKTPLCAVACQLLLQRVVKSHPEIPQEISALILGDANVGAALSESKTFPLISATGSVPMGKNVAKAVASRLGKSLLELGGNNGAIVSAEADVNEALPALVFSAVGTAGQRCTTLRRLIIHHSLEKTLVPKLISAYKSLAIGDPRDEKNLIGPLIGESSFTAMQLALLEAQKQGGKILYGGERLDVVGSGCYVKPALVKIKKEASILQTETFAPILYIITYTDLEEAIAINNGVPQGLSSSIFTLNIKEAEYFMSAAGSDCGIANVNIGTSGAEIGGAFGGEKDTGGGRESGSDAWKNYMRRTTNTINYGSDIPLAQGIQFNLD